MPPLLAPLLALSLSLRPAVAAEGGIPLEPPVPVAGRPWSALATAWALPPQRVEYLTEEVDRLPCPVAITLQPDGIATADADACPEAMRAAALEAAAQWTFQPVDPGPAPATLGLTFVVRYNAELGAMTLFAELDPGPAHAFEEGRPGLKLVRPATPRGADPGRLEGKLKGKQRKAGLAAADCALRVRVGPDGRATESLVVSCPLELAAGSQALALGARWEPGTVDGQPVEDVTDVVVSWR
ncbi:energy transducer TonB [Myxococcota bacterium]|nr:energy transducer TonB [Myxococcota bacterium]